MTSKVVRRICETLEWCGAALLVLVSLPVIALLVLVFRAVLLAAAVALLVGAIGLYCAYAPFRQRVDALVHGAGPTQPLA